MDILPLPIPGCFDLRPKSRFDARGRFVKTFQSSLFVPHGDASVSIRESFYSVSRKDVIRGFHVQSPPSAQYKSVICVAGRVLDVLLDLRMGSPTYGKTCTIELSGDKANGVWMDKGIAHAFCSLAEDTCLLYQVSSEYNPQADVGILWSSVDVDWPVKSPILSDRDRGFPAFKDFVSPFIYSGEVLPPGNSRQA